MENAEDENLDAAHEPPVAKKFFSQLKKENFQHFFQTGSSINYVVIILFLIVLISIEIITSIDF
jgi:hypothetical protein